MRFGQRCMDVVSTQTGLQSANVLCGSSLAHIKYIDKWSQESSMDYAEIRSIYTHRMFILFYLNNTHKSTFVNVPDIASQLDVPETSKVTACQQYVFNKLRQILPIYDCLKFSVRQMRKLVEHTGKYFNATGSNRMRLLGQNQSLLCWDYMWQAQNTETKKMENKAKHTLKACSAHMSTVTESM